MSSPKVALITAASSSLGAAITYSLIIPVLPGLTARSFTWSCGVVTLLRPGERHIRCSIPEIIRISYVESAMRSSVE